jgi:hypothetical protein
MFTKMGGAYCVGAAAFALFATTAGATDTTVSAPVAYDGHYYEIVINHGVRWDQAKTDAEARTYNGVQGHLATIGSAAEDTFIDQLRRQTLVSHPEIHDSEFWVGGYQVACVTSAPEPGCGWLWINGDSIAAANTDSPYTNWQPGEPNNVQRNPDANNLASEDFLTVGKSGRTGWNDEGYLPFIWGYVVEYGDAVTIPAEVCADGAGCNPTGAQMLQYPPTATVAADATLTARTYHFHDDPARCGKTPLSLFNGAVVIPPYLCGHPDFVVIETTSTGVDISQGVISVENLTQDVLPGNLYGCTATRLNPVGVTDPDPSHRDVVAWQAADATQMLETTLGRGQYLGTLTEVTYGCGSSRGKVINGSYHFIGLRIYAGDGNDYDSNPAGNHQALLDLTRYKLGVLQASVIASKPALSTLSYLALKTLTDAAIYFHEHGRYQLALLNVNLFVDLVNHTKYAVIAGKNYNGEHLMRASNLQFMYTDKLIPFN